MSWSRDLVLELQPELRPEPIEVVVELVAHLVLELARSWLAQAFELASEVLEVGLHDGCRCLA